MLNILKSTLLMALVLVGAPSYSQEFEGMSGSEIEKLLGEFRESRFEDGGVPIQTKELAYLFTSSGSDAGDECREPNKPNCSIFTEIRSSRPASGDQSVWCRENTAILFFRNDAMRSRDGSIALHQVIEHEGKYWQAYIPLDVQNWFLRDEPELTEFLDRSCSNASQIVVFVYKAGYEFPIAARFEVLGHLHMPAWYRMDGSVGLPNSLNEATGKEQQQLAPVLGEGSVEGSINGLKSKRESVSGPSAIEPACRHFASFFSAKVGEQHISENYTLDRCEKIIWALPSQIPQVGIPYLEYSIRFYIP